MPVTTLDHAILDSFNMGIYFVDTDMKVMRWNKTVEDITGYTMDELLGQSCKGNLLCLIEETSEPLCNNGCPLKATIQDSIPREALAFVRTKTGERVPIKAETKPVIVNDAVVGAIACFSKSEQAGIDQQDPIVDSLTKIALTDKLTGLYNRGYFEGEVNVKLTQMLSDRTRYVVFFLDIDNFSNFNNTYGHDIGDLVLVEMAKAVTSSIRKTDAFCRWGGEEFVGLFQMDSVEGLISLSDKVLEHIRNIRIEHQGNQIGITASVGITTLRFGDTLESVVSRADALMYKSKEAGKDRYTIDC